jgi:hypothetical protein
MLGDEQVRDRGRQMHVRCGSQYVKTCNMGRFWVGDIGSLCVTQGSICEL